MSKTKSKILSGKDLPAAVLDVVFYSGISVCIKLHLVIKVIKESKLHPQLL